MSLSPLISKSVYSDTYLDEGYKSEVKPPGQSQCAYCRGFSRHRGIPTEDIVTFWVPTPIPCQCDGATKARAKMDQLDEVRRVEKEKQQKAIQFAERVEKNLGSSGIKKRFATRTFESYTTETKEQSTAKTKAIEYAKSFENCNGRGLYIEGRNGTGKTHLAVAIATETVKKGYTVICKTSGEMLEEIKGSFADGKETEILRIYKKTDLLVIDDLGKELCTDWSISTLYNIVNDRYEEMRPIIVTTNFNEEVLLKNLTPKGGDNQKAKAILSRLAEVSDVITMAGEDYRRK